MWAASRDLRCDVAIIGGGVGGCAAALAAVRNGMRVVMTEETDWVGGQLTSQAVPPDEHPWIESFGGTRLYRTYRQKVRDYYRSNYPLTAEARSAPNWNPGGGLVSRLTHEPKISLAVLEEMLAPAISGGHLTVLLRHKARSCDVVAGSLRSVTVRNMEAASDRSIEAQQFLDATEQGDLLPLSKTEHVTGSESRRKTGEAHAPENDNTNNIQSFTICFAMDYLKDEDHTVDRPSEYEFWRDYVPKLTPSWPGKLLSWSMTNPVTLEKRDLSCDPEQQTSRSGPLNLWLYRRIAARSNFIPGAFAGDITLVNWPQNDYWLGNLHGVSEVEADRHLRRAKQLSLSLLYWMQTEAPRPDGGAGFRGLRLRRDVVGTEDGLAKYPYVRESRRLEAEFTVLEQHVSTEARRTTTGPLTAEYFKDSVGIGSYRIDLHPSSGGDNYIDVSSLPFQIPLGALIPKRTENLIAACKNIGTTHITNGCFRLHPVEWNIGESAGMLAAYCVRQKKKAREVRNTQQFLTDFQKVIEVQGIEIAWPSLTAR